MMEFLNQAGSSTEALCDGCDIIKPDYTHSSTDLLRFKTFQLLVNAVRVSEFPNRDKSSPLLSSPFCLVLVEWFSGGMAATSVYTAGTEESPDKY